MSFDTPMADEFDRRPCIRDAVPIKVNRVFDSCSDRECIANVPVILDNGELPCNIQLVKSKCVRVADVCMRIEPVPFNRGFYNIDLTFTFRVELLAYTHACEKPKVLEGTVYASKSSILYGSESNTQTFYSNGNSVGKTDACCEIVNLPTANVQVVSPLALETKIGTVCRQCDPCQQGNDNFPPTMRTVIMTLGLFSVIELTRPVTIMVPTYDYTIPSKECCNVDTETPCAVFDKMRFPTEEFSPMMLNDNHDSCDTHPKCDCGS
ncbi:MAG: hypothetical protein K2H93_00420 [Oscillospiraceae bacterium]|nr:hypothetical protein [Oscillospiraceae bacterium]MDE6777641.1 hypothetical protein [Oscillospiraceae bacterium]